ncbi:hypothetical protein [Mycobacterium sp. SA01]|uniref:hypothetical protein n=1 Tax=Mycobacterium sp. SA01 TaxID=3238820 RepID=UPI00351B31DB
MDTASAVLHRDCMSQTAGTTVSEISEQFLPNGHPGQSLRAVLTTTGARPTITHEYLVSDLRSSTVVELAMWSSSPAAVDWPDVSSEKLFADMVAPLCAAYVNSCA